MSEQRTLTDLFKEELTLCEVGPGQTVAVLTEGDELRDYAAASLAACRDLGATVIDVNVPSDAAMDASERIANVGQNPLSQHPELLQQCMDADMVVDHMLLLFSHEQVAMQKAGTRVILIVEPREILERLFPSPALRARVEAAEKRLANASTLRFVNEAGTDITYALGGTSILTEYGYTATPGRWDHWPGGFLATLGIPDGVSGRVVMDAGDIVFPLKKALKEPVEFIVRNGWVKEISGGDDAEMIRAFIKTYDDARAYAISHIGWGLNERCAWDPDLPGIGMDGRAYYGNVLFSLGPDTEFGGDNDTPCHLDLPMRNCSLWLDNDLIVEHGEVVPAEMRP